MEKQIEKAIRETLVISNPQSIHLAVKKILLLLNDSGSFLADEFHEWIELYEWQFNPVSFNREIKYRWVNETYSGQATTKELYELFLSQK
jgi:hypothetical protein